MGYAVISAKDGQEGLTLARKEKPDLIVLDITLPKINGYKISRLLKFDSRYKDIPIIMLTSRETQQDEQIGLESGADIYIYKSDRTGKLLKTNSFVNKSKSSGIGAPTEKTKNDKSKFSFLGGLFGKK